MASEARKARRTEKQEAYKAKHRDDPAAIPPNVPPPAPRDPPLPFSADPLPPNSVPRRRYRWLELAEFVPTDAIKRREVYGLISDLVLAAVPGVVPMLVVWRWIIWFACWCGIVYLLMGLVNPLNRLPRRTRISIGCIAIAGFIGGFGQVAKGMWRQERASLLTGYISAGVAVPHWQNYAERLIELSPGSVLDLRYRDGPQIKPLYDAGIRVDMGPKGPELSTAIRDREGHLVVTVNHNYWTVFSACSDKNYSKDSLEVLDSRGHVVLQVRLFPDRIQLHGEWHDEFGNGLRLRSQYIDMWRTPQMELRLEHLIEPRFEYPSAEHWGELRRE